MEFNRDLIQKYNVPVPRYTSYPPANLFNGKFSSEDYIKALNESNSTQPQNISFYIHIPFCKKLCFYCGCNSCPLSKDNEVEEYISALKKEINLIISHLDKSRKISQIHYGGGTPNSIHSIYLKEINQLLIENFKTTENPEIAIECHPAYLNEKYILELKEAGFNRYSLGIQDFDSQVLKNVNRDPSYLEIQDLLNLIRKQPNSSVNLDFIYGLPGQNKQSFHSTIEKAISLKPNRMVTFSYAHVPWVNKNQKILEKRGLPNQEEKMQMFEIAYNLLKDNNYQTIGLDHYVLESDKLYKALQQSKLHRNFQGYCTRETTGQVYAFGVSAISQLQNVYTQNTKSIEEYISKINKAILPIVRGHKLSDNEKYIREVITILMCNKKVYWQPLAKHLKIEQDELLKILNFDGLALKEFIDDKIIILTDEGIEITEQGVLFIRNVASTLDPAFKAGEGVFSKAV